MSYEIKNQIIDAQNGHGQGQNGPIMPAALDLDVERSVRLYPKLAAAVAIAAFVGVVGYALRQQPMYTAQTSVYIQPVATKLLSDGTPGYYDSNKYDSYIQQQILTATRADILKSALEKMPAGTWQMPGESEEHAIDRLQSALRVQRVQTTYQLTFGVTSPNQAAVAPAANAVTDAFLKLGRKDELSQTDDRMQLLAEERDRITKELEGEREEQRQLSASIGVANPAGEAGNPYDMQLAELRSQLSSARKDRDVAASQLETVSGPSPAALDTAAEELIQADSTLAAMKTTISERKGQLTSQMAGLTANNPLYRQDQLEMQQLDKSLDTMTTQMREKAARRLQDKLRLDLARTADVESRLNAQLAKQTGIATGAAPRLQRANDLAADITRMQQRYATIDDTMRSLALESSSPGLAHLVAAATPPDGPDPSRRMLLLLASIPLALFLGAAAAVIATKRDRHVYIGKDLDKLLGFQPIAVLPARADVSQNVMDEYVLRLAGGIDQALRRGRARSYLLTGASPSIDASELVRELADKMEQLGFRTVLVSAAAVLQPLPEGAAKADSVSISKGMPNALSGVHQSLLVANLERLKRGNDLLLIESDPLLVSAETEYVARLADVTIVIAESGVTLREDLLRAAALLKRLSASGVGAVLTELHVNAADQAFRSSIKSLEGRQYTGVRPVQERPVRQALEETEPEQATPVVVAPEEFVAAHEYYEPAPAEQSVHAAAAEHLSEPVAVAEPVVEHSSWHEPAHAAEAAYSAFETKPEPAAVESVVSEPAFAEIVEEPVLSHSEPLATGFSQPAVESVAEPVAEAAVEPELPVHHEPTVFAQYAASAAHFDPIHAEVPAMQIHRIVEAPTEPLAEPAAPHETVATEPIAPRAAQPEFEAADLHFNPNISRQRMAFRGTTGRVQAEEEEQPKRSWVHRLFRRDTPQVSYSIIPTDDEDDEIEEVAPELVYTRSDRSGSYMTEPVAEPSAATSEQAAEPASVHEPVVLHEPVAHAPEPVAVSVPAELEPVQEPVSPVAVGMEPAPEVHWTPLAGSQTQAEEAAFVHEALPEPIAPVVEDAAAHAVEPVAEVLAEPIVEHAIHVEPETHEAVEQRWAAFAEPASEAAQPVVETHAEAVVAHAAVEFEEPTVESVNSVVEPLVQDSASVPHLAAPEQPAARTEPEFEVSMPLVPMSTDFKEPSFEPLPDVHTWAQPEPEAQPVEAAQEVSRSNVYESYRPAAVDVQPEPVAAAVEHFEPAHAESVYVEPAQVDAPVFTPEPTYASEPEPVYAAAEPVAPLRAHREVERPAHVPRRFHLLSQFDRPLSPRNDVRESNGGSR
ncbi:Uncharacterized protein involved in exopolysaccharide biosynthesis [Granulicella rosea]|uniref:Uncharacterized protein involved in exopolysaccharide biosynthesis n=1 Tax=Granulicella rosea TaxID=474952 RepID=A0A239ET93_9BACT|nr:hypothetical protein [Granulicella rosea]SNS47847.1 Uncharacterized protein involved in exopolysaccharide biosynthesis [Granulicella rosea]